MKRLILILTVLLCLWCSGLYGAGPRYYKGGADTDAVYLLVASDAPGTFKRGGPPRVRICDGTADDVEAQAIADQIAADGFGTLKLSPGSFTFAACVLLDDNTTMQGAGQGVTTITSAAAANNPLVANEDWDDDGTENVNITIRGITFDNDRDNQTDDFPIRDGLGNTGTLFFGEVTGLTIEHCTVNNSHRAGIVIVQSTDILIDSCRVDDTNDDGIGIDDACNGAVVSHCVVTNAGQSNDYGSPAAIEIQDAAQNVTVKGCYLSTATTKGSSYATGIRIASHASYNACHDITIIGNQIEIVTGSWLLCNHDTAASAQWPYNITVTGNIFHTNSTDISLGVAFAKVRRLTFADNIIYKENSSGTAGTPGALGLDEAHDVTVTGNIFYVPAGGVNVSDTAIRLGGVGNDPSLIRVKITDNIFTNWDYTIFNVEDGSTLTMTDVEVLGNTSANPDTSTDNFARWNDTGGGTYSRCVWGPNRVSGTTNLHLVNGGSNFGNSSWTEELHSYADVDTADGSQSAMTIYSNKKVIELTINDEHGCDVTMDETAAVDGFQCRIMNLSTNVADFVDQAGVLELDGGAACTLGQGDFLVIEYHGGAWWEVLRKDN
jgi:hypothetical protein